ncbi:hypothetical protein BK663_09180 [Pseudomonas lini]|uniref:Uncharacterized protein n=1 Tax=Pseudomonas lini TaxID=163011 RepID=A0A423IRS9_9PSED|nr:hypothetical protein BK663_09180 [Pseudomonas lini]
MRNSQQLIAFLLNTAIGISFIRINFYILKSIRFRDLWLDYFYLSEIVSAQQLQIAMTLE